MTNITNFTSSGTYYERINADSLNDTLEIVNDALNRDFNDIDSFFDNLLTNNI